MYCSDEFLVWARPNRSKTGFGPNRTHPIQVWAGGKLTYDEVWARMNRPNSCIVQAEQNEDGI